MAILMKNSFMSFIFRVGVNSDVDNSPSHSLGLYAMMNFQKYAILSLECLASNSKTKINLHAAHMRKCVRRDGC